MHTKHTPGPWKVGYGDGITGSRTAPSSFWDLEDISAIPIRSRKDNYMEAVAWVAKSGQKDNMMVADACLIAAAPELLEALKRAEMNLHGMTTPEIRSMIASAIAKAEGKE